MRHAPRALLAAGLGFAVSFLVACGGGDGLLAPGDASNLNSQLDSISSAVGTHDCAAAQSALNGFVSSVNGLPATLNSTLRTDLLDGASTVGVLAQRDCRQTTSSTTKSTTSTSTTKSTTSTTTKSTTSTTTPSTSTTTPSTSTSTSTSTTPATSTTTTGTTSTTSGGAGVGGGTTTTSSTGGGNGNGGN